MIRRPPRSTLFPSRRSSDLPSELRNFMRFSDARLQAESSRYMYSEQGLLELIRAVLELVCHLLMIDRKSTRLNSSHQIISYAVFCLKKKKIKEQNIAHQYVS